MRLLCPGLILEYVGMPQNGKYVVRTYEEKYGVWLAPVAQAEASNSRPENVKQLNYLGSFGG